MWQGSQRYLRHTNFDVITAEVWLGLNWLRLRVDNLCAVGCLYQFHFLYSLQPSIQYGSNVVLGDLRSHRQAGTSCGNAAMAARILVVRGS
jgi:hypothetical protein